MRLGRRRKGLRGLILLLWLDVGIGEKTRELY
jgi:hypothetical protein